MNWSPRAAVSYAWNHLLVSVVAGQYTQLPENDYLIRNISLPSNVCRQALFSLQYEQGGRFYKAEFYYKIIRNWNYRFRTVSLPMDMDTVKVLICIFVTMPYGRILSTVCLTLITSRNVNIGNIQNLRCHSMLPVITHRWC